MKLKKMMKELNKVISILIVKSTTDEDIKIAVKKLVKIAVDLDELDKDIKDLFKNFNSSRKIK